MRSPITWPTSGAASPAEVSPATDHTQMYTLLGATLPESRTGEGAMSEPLLHWIDGESVASVDGTTRTGTDPSTGGPGAQVSLGTAADVDRAVRAAHRARTSWRHLGSLDRGRILAAIGRRLLAELDALAAMETADTGKPLALSAAEIRGAAEYFEFYAALVNLPAGEVLDIQPNLHVYTLREPLGVVGVITPWNLPLNQAARACAPALAAGNTVVAKPAEATSRTTVELARMAAEEGLPPGVLNVVLGLGPEVGTAIVAAPPGAQGRVHRVGAGRSGDRPHRRRSHPAADPRARRKVGQHRLRRRRPGLRRDRGGAGLRDQRRPGLLVRHPPAGAAARCRIASSKRW